jgi:hypothetical protein
MILRYALPLVLYLKSHEIEKILEFELDNVKPVAVLNSRRIITITITIVVMENIILLLLVHHGATRMIRFRLHGVRNALIAKINAMIEAI